jgi:hypothetical protein
VCVCGGTKQKINRFCFVRIKHQTETKKIKLIWFNFLFIILKIDESKLIIILIFIHIR